jgi:Skp family chaperone for outer membrane proteins
MLHSWLCSDSFNRLGRRLEIRAVKCRSDPEALGPPRAKGNRQEGEVLHIRLINSLLLLPLGIVLLLPTASLAQVGVSVAIAPPELPVYEQPMCPGDGYIWTPGYWAWDGEYYWVPGTWVMAPEVGFLWTPGYWGWGGSGFLFSEGYWGLSVGFYGGINYGFGYFGHGYEGGRWQNGHFFYNTVVNRVDGNVIHNVYETRVNETANRVSYNGGNGGITERATPEEEAAARGRHIGPVAAQTQHAYSARNNPQQRYSANHGAPPVTATPRANLASHPKELPPIDGPAAPNTGNKKLDQKYQKEQEKLVTKQNQDRQKLQQTQEKEHQQLARQKPDPVKTQQLEQRHQQQTQQLQQNHTQQMQQVQQRQSAGSGGARGGGRR